MTEVGGTGREKSIRDRPMKAIRDCPIAFMSRNKLVDIFAN